MAAGYHPRRQGDLGEASAIELLTASGGRISFPLFHSPDYDLILELNGRLLRVQVKTSTRRTRIGNWHVMLATRGGNQSWNGLVKRFDSSRCELLFALVGDGRRWLVPASEIEGRVGITLGGPKYSEFEVERGRGLEPTGLQSPEAGGSAGAGEPGRTVNPVAMPEWVRFPPPPSPSRERVGPDAVGRTRISANHQVTIPMRPFRAAGVSVGDLVRVEASGRGRLILTRTGEAAAEPAPGDGGAAGAAGRGPGP